MQWLKMLRQELNGRAFDADHVNPATKENGLRGGDEMSGGARVTLRPARTWACSPVACHHQIAFCIGRTTSIISRPNCGIDRAIVAITMLIEVVACSSATRFSFGGEGRGCCTPNFLVGSLPKAKDDKKALPWQEVPTPNCERRNGTLSNAPRPQSESPSKPGVGKIGQRRPIKPPFQRVILCQLVEWPPGLAGEIQQALMNGGCDVFQRLHRVASR